MNDDRDKINLNNEDGYLRYAGRCRICQEPTVWMVEQKDYSKFYRYVTDQFSNPFRCYCEGCGNLAVFDLIGLTKDKDHYS